MTAGGDSTLLIAVGAPWGRRAGCELRAGCRDAIAATRPAIRMTPDSPGLGGRGVNVEGARYNGPRCRGYVPRREPGAWCTDAAELGQRGHHRVDVFRADVLRRPLRDLLHDPLGEYAMAAEGRTPRSVSYTH